MNPKVLILLVEFKYAITHVSVQLVLLLHLLLYFYKVMFCAFLLLLDTIAAKLHKYCGEREQTNVIIYNDSTDTTCLQRNGCFYV